MENRLFKIEAEIKLHLQGGRTQPIETGYRPGLNFINNTKTSGAIRLLTSDYLNLGENDIAEISFISSELLGEIHAGTEFKFYEGPVEIGIGKILNVVGWV